MPPATLPGGVAHFERRAMGSPLRLTVVGLDDRAAAAAWTAVSDLIEEIEEALSRFRSSSDLTALNRRAGAPEPRPVGRWLARAVATADRAYRVTGGAFDPRVLVALERLGYRGAAPAVEAPMAGAPRTAPAPLTAGAPRTADAPRMAGAPRTAAAPLGADTPTAAFLDGRWLHAEPRRSALAVAAPIDLGGIGKGLALRWAGRALARSLERQRGDSPERPVTGALLEAGGDLVALGPSPQGGPWLVGVEDPLGGDERAVVAVADGAVATSSVRVHAWRAADGRVVHHLVDPATGEPGGAGLLAVTVAGPDPAWAEVHSKTLFLAGPRGIGPRARALGLAAWWVAADGTLEMTPAARVRTAWLAAEA